MALPKAVDNVYTGKELDTLYKRYVSEYNDKAASLKRKGISMYVGRYSKIEFQNMYAAFANDITKKFGSEKAKASYIIDKMVDRQSTEFTKAQAMAYQKAFKEAYGKDITLKEIYRTTEQIKAQMSEMNEKLIGEGLNSSDRQLLISAAFFGSPT